MNSVRSGQSGASGRTEPIKWEHKTESETPMKRTYLTMARTCRVTRSVRIINRIIKALVRLGIGSSQMHILTVAGRTSGRFYSTPVSTIEQDGEHWLVSPYREVAWVRNARASGVISLQCGRRSETMGIEEVDPEQSAPVLKTYVGLEAIRRPYLNAAPDVPIEEFAVEASRHPVFRIVPK